MRELHVRGRSALLGGAVAIGFVLSGCSTTSTLELQVGDCLDLPDDADLSVSFELATVQTVACSKEHEAQVFAQKQLPDGEYPGFETIESGATSFCAEQFADFVGIEPELSNLGTFPLMPTEDSWKIANDRTVLCVAISPTPVAGTFKDARL